MEKSTKTYQDFVEEVRKELAERLRNGEISEKDFKEWQSRQKQKEEEDFLEASYRG